MARSREFFILVLFFSLLSSVISVSFKISRFDSSANNILYEGDANPSVGAIELTSKTYLCHVGRATYAERVKLWDSDTGKLTNFSTHFTFWIDTQGNYPYSAGLTFFLAPVGFHIPLNSVGGFLGLFNTTTSDSPDNQIVMVEFDTYNNPEWDPPDVDGHVGINNNSISSTVYTPWNLSLHDGDNADVWIAYDADTKNLSVKWTYQTTNNLSESSSLSLKIDLREVLPEWVTIGFSAATGSSIERHVVSFWEFSSSLESDEKSPKRAKKTTIVIVVVAVSTGVFVVVAAIVISMILKGKSILTNRTSEDTVNLTSINNDDLERGAGPRRYSYKELVSATRNFSDDRRLGQGGFGTVYRGLLIGVNIEVAVKRISRGSKQGKKEYMTEVKIISQLRHRNLVQLIGWCHEKGDLLLVYEFMPNGSLDSHLFGRRTPLNWGVRYNIALGLASGLLYLHEEWQQCVVHRDIKSSNVMLDSNFSSKLGDFGLARLMDHDLGLRTTGLAGTFGYLAPECLSARRASKESDVYSFGVVALEIVTGKNASSFMEERPQYGLVSWVWDLYESGELHLAVDNKLNPNFDKNQVDCLLIVGLWCAHPDFTQRPSVRQAIQVLKFETGFPNIPTKMPVPTFPALQTTSSESSSCGTITNSSIVVGR